MQQTIQIVENEVEELPPIQLSFFPTELLVKSFKEIHEMMSCATKSCTVYPIENIGPCWANIQTCGGCEYFWRMLSEQSDDHDIIRVHVQRRIVILVKTK